MLAEEKKLKVEDADSRAKAWLLDTLNNPGNETSLPKPNGIKHSSIRSCVVEYITSLPPAITEHAKRSVIIKHSPKKDFKNVATPKGFAGNQPILTPQSIIYGSLALQEYIEGIVKTNERVFQSLARQYLPKCHSQVFEGDPTLFYRWKR